MTSRDPVFIATTIERARALVPARTLYVVHITNPKLQKPPLITKHFVNKWLNRIINITT